jgi:hypothetical protein
MLKRSSAINVERAFVLENVSVVNAAHNCPNGLSRLVFHKQLIGGDDALHLLLIATTIRMVAFRQRSIAAFNLLRRGIWWKAQHR